MNDKPISKQQQIQALRERNAERSFLLPRKPHQISNPFQDAALGRDPAPKKTARLDGDMRRDAVTGDGQTIEAVELPKGLATATNLGCPVCAEHRRKKAEAQKRFRSRQKEGKL